MASMDTPPLYISRRGSWCFFTQPPPPHRFKLCDGLLSQNCLFLPKNVFSSIGAPQCGRGFSRKKSCSPLFLEILPKNIASPPLLGGFPQIEPVFFSLGHTNVFFKPSSPGFLKISALIFPALGEHLLKRSPKWDFPKFPFP